MKPTTWETERMIPEPPAGQGPIDPRGAFVPPSPGAAPAAAPQAPAGVGAPSPYAPRLQAAAAYSQAPPQPTYGAPRGPMPLPPVPTFGPPSPPKRRGVLRAL